MTNCLFSLSPIIITLLITFFLCIQLTLTVYLSLQLHHANISTYKNTLPNAIIFCNFYQYLQLFHHLLCLYIINFIRFIIHLFNIFYKYILVIFHTKYNDVSLFGYSSFLILFFELFI